MSAKNNISVAASNLDTRTCTIRSWCREAEGATCREAEGAICREGGGGRQAEGAICQEAEGGICQEGAIEWMKAWCF